MDIKTEQYLKRQNPNHLLIIDEIRSLILNNFPSIKETVMAEGLWYEGIFYLATIGDHVNLGVGIKGLSADELKPFQGKGKTQRHLKFYSVTEIQRAELLELMNLVHKRNREAQENLPG